jgi:hypothetical protein
MKTKALIMATAAIASGILIATAEGARSPTRQERTLIVQAVTAGMEAAENRSVPSFRGKVTGIKMSVVTTPRAFFNRYAAASYFDPTIGGAAVFLGFRRSYWHVLSYGSSDVGCGYPQRLLGGRRQAILADLGLDCP